MPDSFQQKICKPQISISHIAIIPSLEDTSEKKVLDLRK